ncbi:hypothetical protein LJ739_12610 [Aestuariibacter halophilus]|uniref:High-affinity iron transporter n=1 Tax=Fluctibacter halophilus TaxID=226011 RepID=A0ABS8GD32_9ALTE|nr:hypothetical protein [Aestuariibacter halophilus]MCC2617086.1 hypothetical protein [Aestuariibacter halophilus]
MLINTVILFLRDALPVFLLLGLLWSINPHWKRWLLHGLLSGILLLVVIFINVASVSEWFEGAGYELLQMLLHTLLFVALIAYLTRPDLTHKMLAAMTTLVLATNGTSFTIYVLGYWAHQQGTPALSVGTALGVGICLSIAVLLFLALSSASLLWRRRVLCLFVAGQSAGIAPLLAQVNWLPEQVQVWDSNALLRDTSEYGHLAKALFGYEATPSLAYLLLYALFVSVSLYFAQRASHSEHRATTIKEAAQ